MVLVLNSNDQLTQIHTLACLIDILYIIDFQKIRQTTHADGFLAPVSAYFFLHACLQYTFKHPHPNPPMSYAKFKNAKASFENPPTLSTLKCIEWREWGASNYLVGWILIVWLFRGTSKVWNRRTIFLNFVHQKCSLFGS